MTCPKPLEGVQVDPFATIVRCRSCGAPIWWGKTAAGKRCPFDVLEHKHTAISHFATCPQARQWTKR